MPYRERSFYVYIMGSLSGTLYIGFTSAIVGRSMKHKLGCYEGFTKKYGVDRLLYYEVFDDPRPAIAREKQLKGWIRAKRIALIEQRNPHWEDLSREWYEDLVRRYDRWQDSLKVAVSQR